MNKLVFSKEQFLEEVLKKRLLSSINSIKLFLMLLLFTAFTQAGFAQTNNCASIDGPAAVCVGAGTVTYDLTSCAPDKTGNYTISLVLNPNTMDASIVTITKVNDNLTKVVVNVGTKSGNYTVKMSTETGHPDYIGGIPTASTEKTTAVNAAKADAGGDKVLTCTTTFIKLDGSSPTAGITAYAWVASNGGNIVSGANTATPTVDASGTYTLTVTGPALSFCKASDDAIVTLNNTKPDAKAGDDKVLTCTTTSFILDGSSTTTGATFAWVASNGGNIFSGANTATPTVDKAGTYTLTVTDPANGCTKTDDAVVTENIAKPNADAGLDKVLTCITTSFILDGSSTTTGATFAWVASNGGNIVSGANTTTPTVDKAGTYTLTVTDPANGCTATQEALVTVNTTPPNADAGAGKVITCGNTTVVLSGSSSTANATFAWVANGGGNIVSDANTATPTVNAAGTYTLTVTDPANGCTATNVVLVTVQPCTTFDGCSPGFWKNHETLWNQFTNFPPAHMPAGLKFITTTNYFTYFGITPGSNGMPTNLTMHGAISQGGGGCKALSRHAVSALLSSASGLNIEYPTGTSDFTSLYNAIRAALLSGKCSGPLFSQLEKISDADHSNCGKFNALRSIHGNSANIETEVIKNISVVSFPNPYNDKVQFTLKSDITGKGVLEVFNAMGQKMQTVFEGNVVAGRSQTIQYNVPANNRTNLIYRFRVGDKTASGKLLKP